MKWRRLMLSTSAQKTPYCGAESRRTHACWLPPLRGLTRIALAASGRSRCQSSSRATNLRSMAALGATQHLPIAYLPGASGHSAIWEPIASVLAHRRKPLLFDYPGLGERPDAPWIRDLADLTSWVAEQLPAVCDVVTISMGSSLGLRLALEHPDRVRRLVLVAPCGGLSVARFGALDWRASFLRQRPRAPRWFVDDQSDFSQRLRTLAMPTLAIFGDEDLIAPPAIGILLMAQLPIVRMEVIQNASHDLEQEHPAFVASLIEAHLRR